MIYSQYFNFIILYIVYGETGFHDKIQYKKYSLLYVTPRKYYQYVLQIHDDHITSGLGFITILSIMTHWTKFRGTTMCVKEIYKILLYFYYYELHTNMINTFNIIFNNS